jgi:hypothetical protein
MSNSDMITLMGEHKSVNQCGQQQWQSYKAVRHAWLYTYKVFLNAVSDSTQKVMIAYHFESQPIL